MSDEATYTPESVEELRDFVEAIEKTKEAAREAVEDAIEALAALAETIKETFADVVDTFSKMWDELMCFDYIEPEYSNNCVIYLVRHEKKRETRSKVNNITRWASRKAHPC